MSRIAVVPGSFDPVTLGHLDIIERAAGVFDAVHVVVVHNPAKQALLPIAQRVTLIEQAVADRALPSSIIVTSWSVGLLVDYCTDVGASVLVKGGHLSDDSAADVLCTDDGLYWIEADRTPDVQTHGTGCTYSASIAAGLAQGLNLLDAVTQAKGYISAAIADHFGWQTALGTVHALNHLHQNAE